MLQRKPCFLQRLQRKPRFLERGARGARGPRPDADAESKVCLSHFCPETSFRSRIGRADNLNQARRQRYEKNEKSEWRNRKPQERNSTKKTKNRSSETGSHKNATRRKIHEKRKIAVAREETTIAQKHEKSVSQKPTARTIFF